MTKTTMRSALAAGLVVALAMLPRPALGASCDAAGADASALADARAAIDAACPCAAAATRSAHLKCAKPVVDARVTAGSLPKLCRTVALAHAKLSTCGAPGAVVCCRVKTVSHRTTHKISKTADKCVAKPTVSACVSAFTSVDLGCDANGCIYPQCGDGIVTAGETCDPPDYTTCDGTCHVTSCEAPPTSCGNGTIDAGEACEPPAIGACGADCQLAPCAAPAGDEIALSCANGAATVGAGSDGSGYVVAWTGRLHRTQREVLASHLDANGAAAAATPLVLSEGALCNATPYDPAVASNGTTYGVVWRSDGPLVGVGFFFLAIHARVITDDMLGPLEQLAFGVPFGLCESGPTGPTAAAATAPTVYAALWLNAGACVGGPQFQDPSGVLLDETTNPAGRTTTDVGYLYPTVGSGRAAVSAASIASSAGDTLAVWHAQTTPPVTPFVAAEWLGADGTGPHLVLSSRRTVIGGGRPTVAAGSSSFLVAWGQSASDDATTVTEIRGLRATHAGGPLDADGGFVVATTAGGAVRGGPVVAFDGTGWMVAWSEAGATGNDLRMVAVNADGTIADPSPRLVATGVADTLAIASAGDGRTLVVYVRPDGAASAVRSQLITR